jgi:DNA-binding NtrC family response regulator
MLDAPPLAPAATPNSRTPFRTRVLCFDSPLNGAGQDLGLEPCCYDVVRCGSLPEALDSAIGSHFDVYVVRGCALDGQGAEFYRWVRATHPWTPIVFYPGTRCGPCARKPLKPATVECINDAADPWEIEEAMARAARHAARSRAALVSASRNCEAAVSGFSSQVA